MKKHVNPMSSRILIWSTRHAPYALRRLILLILGCDIGCSLPVSTILGHPFGIVITSATHIGEDVTIMHNVTIGGNGSKKPKDGGAKSIGNHVFIGAGALLLGPISVGDGAVIGAGSVVLKDVPAYATVVGNPARVIRVGKDAF
jgi:serine O-acetyltransferase